MAIGEEAVPHGMMMVLAGIAQADRHEAPIL